MRIKCLFTGMIVTLFTTLPLLAQVGKEMKVFRNKEGITVTMLNPSLYNLYKQKDLSLVTEEVLKGIQEINVMQVDLKQATQKIVEEVKGRMSSIVKNEFKYNPVQSQKGMFSQEHLYVSQDGERTTSLVLWCEEANTLTLIELIGNIKLDRVEEISNTLNVKGLDRLTYINTPSSRGTGGRENNTIDLLKELENRFGFNRDSLLKNDIFGSHGSGFDSMDDLMKQAKEIFGNMGTLFDGTGDMNTMSESISNGLEVTRENGKTRIKVNAKNSEVTYLIDGIEYIPDSLKNGIPEELASVNMFTSPVNPKKSYVVINTMQKAGQFISYAEGTLKYKYHDQEFTVNPGKLSEPSLVINNRLTRDFGIDPVQIIQIRPATDLERQILRAPEAQVIIVTNKMGFSF